MAAKRAREAEPKAEKYLEFIVRVPNDPKAQVQIVSSGKGFKPTVIAHPVRFSTTTTFTFSKLWLRFSEYMLRRPEDSEPFMDFEAPLTSIEGRTFIAVEWKPIYERQRQHLTKLDYMENLRVLEKNIAENEATLEEMRKRRQTLISRIDAIGQTLKEKAQ